MKQKNKSEFQKFDEAITSILSVSHGELKRREAEWKKQRKRTKKSKKNSALSEGD